MQKVMDYLDDKYVSFNLKDDIKPVVFVGRDTRPHSPKFAQLLIDAAKSINAKTIVRDFGEITTPMLHYIVRNANMNDTIDTIQSEIYLSEVTQAFKTCLQIVADISKQKPHLGFHLSLSVFV